MSYQVTESAQRYIRLRRLKLGFKKERQKLRCEEPDDPCWASDVPEEEWCEPCQKRQVVHKEYRALIGPVSGALRRLENIIKREDEPNE
jgi:hypothetical protein